MGRYSGCKLNNLIQFPFDDFDISSFVLNPNEKKIKYKLVGVTEHQGDMTGGHYTSYCLNEIDHFWYYYNDSKVSKVDDLESIMDNAYVLFYVQEEYFVHNNAKEESNSVEEENIEAPKEKKRGIKRLLRKLSSRKSED